jgi:hypothetical protein
MVKLLENDPTNVVQNDKPVHVDPQDDHADSYILNDAHHHR